MNPGRDGRRYARVLWQSAPSFPRLSASQCAHASQTVLEKDFGGFQFLHRRQVHGDVKPNNEDYPLPSYNTFEADFQGSEMV